MSTFSAKIDALLAELNKIKAIRNRFAHSECTHSLDQPPMPDLFKALIRPAGAKGTYLEAFMACVAAIDEELEKFLTSKDAVSDGRIPA